MKVETMYGLKVDGCLDQRTIERSREELVHEIQYGRTWACGAASRALTLLEETGRLEISGGDGKKRIVIEIVSVEVREK